jgi:FHA domain
MSSARSEPRIGRSGRTESLSAGLLDGTSTTCPVCGLSLAARDLFCEGCGHRVGDQSFGPERGKKWVLVVEVDTDDERARPHALDRPTGRPPAVIALEADNVLVGRSSPEREDRPDVDLSGPLVDPAVSHRHLRLRRCSDGGYEVVDLGSTNGTLLRGASGPLEPGRPVRLEDGDRLQIGAWTTLAVRRAP